MATRLKAKNNYNIIRTSFSSATTELAEVAVLAGPQVVRLPERLCGVEDAGDEPLQPLGELGGERLGRVAPCGRADIVDELSAEAQLGAVGLGAERWT